MLLSVSTESVCGTPFPLTHESGEPGVWVGDLPLDGPTLVPDLMPAPGAKDVVDGVVSHGLSGIVDRIKELKKADPLADLSRASPSEYIARVTADGMVQIYAWVDEVTPAVLQGLGGAGLRVELSSAALRVVQGWVHYTMVEGLADVAGVVQVSLPGYGMTNTGSVNTAGDGILNADEVRAAFGATGDGVRVGVISNGIQHFADVQNTGDLPGTITYSSTGTGDEGTAMLEIVYDLAPDADLYFAPASTSASMTTAIAWLVDQGVDIIVDDMTFYVLGNANDAQPYFTDGPGTSIASVAQDAVDSGIVYVTCAGNWQQAYDGWARPGTKSHWQGQFVDNDSNGWHEFTGGDEGNGLVLLPGETIYVNLQWSDPWPGSANDYDLWLLNWNLSDWYEMSLIRQTGTQYPWEELQWTNGSGNNVTVNLAIARFSGLARQLEMFVYTTHGTGLQFATGDTLASQQALEEVIPVGAVDASDSGWDTIEPFSSHGPSTIYTDLGAAQTSTTRETLDLVGIDGVQTKVGQLGFFLVNPFYGTSAAAPHVAALAALLLQVNPGLTPAGVSQALNATAVDLTAYGSGYDETSGWGRADGLGAAYKVYTPDTPDLQADSDTGISSTDNITMDTTPTFVGTVPAGSYVRLYVDDDLEGTQDLGDEVTAYSITTAALAEGSHLVTVRLGVDSSTPTGNLSYESDELQIWIDTTAPTATISEIGTPRSDAVQTAAIDFGESIGDFSVAALSLRRDGGSNLLTSSQTPTTTDQRHWTVPNLAGLTGRAGAYELKLTAAGSQITDVAGNPLAGDAVEEWLMDTINGTSGADTVTLSGSTAQVVTTSDSYAVDLGDFAEYPLNFNLGTGNNTVSVNGDLGQIELDLSGAGGGTCTLTAADPGYTDEVALVLWNSANAEFDSSLSVASLTLHAGTQATLASGGSKVLYTKTLSIAETEGVPTARLDLTDNDLIVDYTGGTPGQPSAQLEAVKRWITAGYASGTWAGNGIASSTAAQNYIVYGLGYAQNDLLFLPYEEFDGFEVDDSTILVKFTYNGDLDLNGCVDDNDVTFFNLYYDGGETGGHYWHQGDIFLYDGYIDDNDVTILGLTYGMGIGDPL
jgi:hypothetical protein